MSYSNRIKRSETTAATSFGALAVLGTTIVLYALGVLNGRETERRERTPTSYSQAAKADAQSACAGSEPSAVFECVYERVEASQEQARGEQDLTAQQRAATSALASAAIALFTLIITKALKWMVSPYGLALSDLPLAGSSVVIGCGVNALVNIVTKDAATGLAYGTATTALLGTAAIARRKAE